MGDLDIGDMGAVDEFGLPIEIPQPQLPDDSGMSSAAASLPGGFSASLAEIGLGGAAGEISVEDGVGQSFAGQLDAMAFSGEQLGSLPAIEDAPALASASAYVPDASPASAPLALSATGEPTFSDAPFASDAQGTVLGGLPPFDPPAPADFLQSGGDIVQDAQGVALGNLPYLEPPAAPDPTFSPVTMGAPEFLDLQMALSPPEPSQEGFAGASEAPMPSSHSIPNMSVGEHSTGSLMSMSEAISEKVWGPSGVSSAQDTSGRSGGMPVRIENLHLQADNPNEFLDGLLGSCPELSNTNLSALA